jgi:TolA-binding protein
LVTVRAIGTARFSRAQSPPDEVVRLDDGSIDLDVVHLRWGERFRVLTSDAEVEVRGTRFRVTASDRRLTSVRVWEGRVEVRPFGGGAAVLDAGDVWEGIPQNDAEDAPNSPFSDSIHADGTRAESADGKPPATISPGRETQLPPHARPGGRAGVTPPDLADRPSGAAPHADPGRRPDAVSSRGNRAFDRAWTLLREGDTANAARAFAEVEALVRGSALEEDALYWRAVATARSKDPRSAPLFSTFLGRFPSSSRAGQAAVALGWIWLDQGKADDAKLMFSRALTDPSPEVVESARAGLRRIDE